jgi:uncharacterized protein YecE (DUF72 family)
MQVWVGTSGYSYPDWVGSFYPPKTRPHQMLGHYCRYFPTVELNFTFYRPPTPGMLARMADQTPAGFQFVVKLPRTLSHEESPQDLPTFRAAVEELRQRGKLLELLCQLPQSHHYERKHLAWLSTLAQELSGYPLAVEFRHCSWDRPDLPAWLRERNLDLVSVDVPDVPALFPSKLVQSGRRIYVRFHSRNAGNWYLSEKDRYDFHYSDEDLRSWVRELAAAAPRTGQALVFLNNCPRSQSVDNARRILELLVSAAPDVMVVEPFAAPALQQRTLFD